MLSFWGDGDIRLASARLRSEPVVVADSASVNVVGGNMVASIQDHWGNVIDLLYNTEYRQRD
ncbi:MAG: hypothetical protein VYE18_03700 [Pseudomonadota bacterium]|nr:hypothetical protein [Pseudomonadota bacterium]